MVLLEDYFATIVFMVRTFSQLSYVMAIRTAVESQFTIGSAGNPPLLGAVLLTILLQLAVIYVPFLQSLFNTDALMAQ